MSLVSVVIPVYNQARFVRQAIQSALDQTHPWIDVVVIDDGSTDDTAEVLSAFRNAPNVTVIRQTNAGLAAARNRGLSECRGDFVCFLDSDDHIAPDFAERLLKPLTADPALGMAYCDVQLIDENGEPAGDFSVGQSRSVVTGDILSSLLVGGYFPPHAALVRRRVLDDAGGFETSLGGNADYELWMRLAALGYRAHFVDARLALYRRYEGSMSRDLEHMRTTRIGALERLSTRFPARTAAALSDVQEVATDLHAANGWLRDQWDAALSRLKVVPETPSWSLHDNFNEARLTKGTVEQLGMWDVPEGDGTTRCVFLHPPASLRAVIQSGAAGVLTAIVGLHPDVWTRSEASGCLFSVTIDDVVVGAVTLDPLAREGDRRWVSFRLDVPASQSGQHDLTIETRSVGTGYFAWGLFKDVRFTPAIAA